MKTHHLKDFTKGWFVGNFEPTLFSTDQFEAAIKHYQTGDYERAHVHKIATEITVIVSGRAQMNGKIFEAGDIVVISPMESTDFRALVPTVTSVLKIPCVPNDKFLPEQD